MSATHILAAHAQVPQGTDIYEVHKFITLVIEVDLETGEIVDSMVPMYCQLTNGFIVKILKGKSLDNADEILKEVEERVHTSTKRALMTAMKEIFNRYILEKDKAVKVGA
jgi:hypothetical protein